MIEPIVGLSLLSEVLGGVDLSAHPLDGPLPDIPLDTNASKSRRALLVDLAQRESLSIRQLYLRIAGARGHWQLIGTPEQIADALQERFEAYGAMDTTSCRPSCPGGLDDFVDLVIPELQRRGLFQNGVRRQYLTRESRPTATDASTGGAPPGSGMMAASAPQPGHLALRGVGRQFTVDKAVLTALDSVDLTVPPGAFVTIVGTSGCGKSTLLRLIAGLDTQRGGTITHDGAEVTGPSLSRGIVFQERGYSPG
ncbi:MAG: ATP-binding cassette domain-containing protein [Acetobacteraceae bacterium]